jgi:cytoskeleton protein RodZ
MSITIGQRLKKAREELYLTLEKASDETRIRIIFLQALESDDYSLMPSSAQGRGFLRNYAEYLNINIDEMIADFQKNPPPPEEMSGPLPQVNLVESDIPPLTDPREEKKPPPIWNSWFARRQKAELTPEVESTEPAQEETPIPIAEGEAEQPKPRSRRKKKVEEEFPPTPPVEPVSQPEQAKEIKVEGESLPINTEQMEDKDEAQPGLLARLASLFRVRLNKSESDMEEADEVPFGPATKQGMPSESASVIFAEIGRRLRERRELISLTIDEVERHTHLRAALVRAMEEGAFDKLPSTVQTRGMLANYAAFLDLDDDTILLRFADAVQARHREKYSETPRERIQTEVATSMPLLRSFIAGDLIFGVVMIALILALAVWGIGRVLNLRDNNLAQATAPSIVEVLAGTPLPTPSVDVTFVPVDDAPLATGAPGQTSAAAPTLGANVNVVINIFAVERTFLRVSVDGEVVFEGRMAPRETQVYEAENQVEVLTGNAAALRITYNGRDLGLMGNVGEVVSRVYTISGIVTPTATIPPTPTETLPTTSTPTSTITPTPTVTITVTP